MWQALAIIFGGAACGYGGLMLRDLAVKRRRRGLPMAPRWLTHLFLPGMAVTVMLGGGSFLFLILARPHEGCTRSTASSNLSQLGKTMAMYADVPGNLGRFPTGGATAVESLWRLYPDFVQDHRVYYCPRDKRPKPSAAPAVRDAQGKRLPPPNEYLAATGYTYLEGYSLNDGEAIIAYERYAIGGGRQVLIGDGHVEWMEEKKFQAALAKQLLKTGK